MHVWRVRVFTYWFVDEVVKYCVDIYTEFCFSLPIVLSCVGRDVDKVDVRVDVGVDDDGGMVFRRTISAQIVSKNENVIIGLDSFFDWSWSGILLMPETVKQTNNKINFEITCTRANWSKIDIGIFVNYKEKPHTYVQINRIDECKFSFRNREMEVLNDESGAISVAFYTIFNAFQLTVTTDRWSLMISKNFSWNRLTQESLWQF